MNKSGPIIDVAQLRDEKLDQELFPGGREPAYRIYFEPNAHAGIWSHASETTAVEICGVLVGHWAKDSEGPFVRVNAFVRGEAAANKFAEVTFTHETWAKINAEMDTKYTAEKIV